jgi:hypothetical protein
LPFKTVSPSNGAAILNIYGTQLTGKLKAGRIPKVLFELRAKRGNSLSRFAKYDFFLGGYASTDTYGWTKWINMV